MMATSGHESPIPSRNPLPLSATQESQVRELYYKNVRAKCAGEIKDFADCATGRTFSISWACRQKRLTMNNCMLQFATLKMQDEAREEWFANMEARKQQQREREKHRLVAEEFNREWWKRNQ